MPSQKPFGDSLGTCFAMASDMDVTRASHERNQGMLRRRCKAIMFVIAFLSSAGSAAFAQKMPSRVIKQPDLSSSLEATTRIVSPSVVEIFTTSHVAGQGAVAQ